jgi:uncharacterized membrane protein
MSERGQEWLFWIAATVLVAMVVHLGAVYLLPHAVMARALEKLGTPNTMHVGRRPDATARAVVRPSPDILYAACPYDLSKGPLRVTSPVNHASYWSVSAFDAATDNYFVKNDQQINGDTMELILVKRGQPWPALDNALERIILYAPTEKGLILIRAVIDTEKDLPALSAMLHQARCGTVASVARLR